MSVMRGRESGRVRQGHASFTLTHEAAGFDVGLVESCVGGEGARWYLVYRNGRKAMTFDGYDASNWRRLDAVIREDLPHPFERSDFCHKLVAVFAHIRDYGPATPLTDLIWEAYADLVHTLVEG